MRHGKLGDLGRATSARLSSRLVVPRDWNVWYVRREAGTGTGSTGNIGRRSLADEMEKGNLCKMTFRYNNHLVRAA